MRRRIGWLLLLVLLTAPAAMPGAAARAEAPRIPLVLLHGFGGSAEAMRSNALPVLAEAGYTEGVNLFIPQLANAADHPLALLREAGQVRAEIERILAATGAEQVDVVGHSQGGVIARILATGETAALVRRAVSIDAPHQGILSDEAIDAMLAEAGVPTALRAYLPIPEQLHAGSPALATVSAREARFGDWRSPALAIGSLWREGAPPVLEGHDGIVPLRSQLAWPGAATRTFRLGPAPEVVAGMPGPLSLVWQSPHAVSQWDAAVLRAAIAFLQEPAASRPAEPLSWPDLEGHWAADLLLPYLPGGLAYSLDTDGVRRFDPDGPMTRAEFVYGLTRLKGLPELLQPSPFEDLSGHWALGYGEAARVAGLVAGLAPDRFGPDLPLSRAEAATLIARALALSQAPPDNRFVDVAGHWAEGWIDAAVARGILMGDGARFRPDDPVTHAEGGLILVRALGDG